MVLQDAQLFTGTVRDSVDTRTEMRVQEALGRLMKGRTSFVIAHRLSTVRKADRIYVMERGRIVEEGDA